MVRDNLANRTIKLPILEALAENSHSFLCKSSISLVKLRRTKSQKSQKDQSNNFQGNKLSHQSQRVHQLPVGVEGEDFLQIPKKEMETT